MGQIYKTSLFCLGPYNTHCTLCTLHFLVNFVGSIFGLQHLFWQLILWLLQGRNVGCNQKISLLFNLQWRSLNPFCFHTEQLVKNCTSSPLTWCCSPAGIGGTRLCPTLGSIEGSMESSMKGLWDSGSRGLKLPEIFSSTGDHTWNPMTQSVRINIWEVFVLADWK